MQGSTWRWIFYINFPFCGFGLVAVPLVVRLEVAKSKFREKILSVDWIGALLFVGSTASLLLGITWGGVQYSWVSYQTLIPIFFGLAGIVGTLFFEWYGTRNPFLRLGVFYSRSAAAVYICAVVQGLIVSIRMTQTPNVLEIQREILILV